MPLLGGGRFSGTARRTTFFGARTGNLIEGINSMQSTILMLLLFSATISLAQDPDSVEIKTTKLTESIFLLEGSGGNIARLPDYGFFA